MEEKHPSNFAIQTNCGLERSLNEDAYLLLPEPGLMLICDGMGGENAGDLASNEAVNSFKEYFSPEIIAQMKSTPEIIPMHMRESCFSAHRHLHKLIEKDPDLNGMGTTAVVAFIFEDALHLVHVGDSRAYRFSGSLELLTSDHSYVMDMVKAGRLTLEEARKHPDNNWIYQAVGGMKPINPEYQSFKLVKGDMVLLCSDGLSDMISSESIESMLIQEGDLSDICWSLISEANKAGGKDNITIGLYEHK